MWERHMHERVVELLVYLMAELRARDQFGEINVTALTKQGYTDAEITTAFAWLFDKLDSRGTQRGAPEQQGSVRMLHPVELSVLQAEGYGFLLQCFQLGLLSSEDVEQVIERIMLAGVSVATVDDVKRVIASVLFETDRPSDGGYPLLGPTDSIH